MKTYEVHYKHHEIIQAENIHEAAKKMQELHPDKTTLDFYNCESGESYEPIGYCEISGRAIFDGDKYSYDSEGVMWLKEFDE